MSTYSVPDSSGITAEWLESMLETYFAYKSPTTTTVESDSEIRVLKFDVEPGCEEGDNLLSDLVAINVEFTRSNTKTSSTIDTAALSEIQDTSSPVQKLSLMAKLLSQDPFCRHFILEAGFDVREIHFYTTLVPALESFRCDKLSRESLLPVPTCYYAKYREGCESVLVLSNLKAEGYSMADFRQGLTFAHTAASLRALATIHATALAYRLDRNSDFPTQFPFLFRPEAAAESYQQLLERGLPQLASFLHKFDEGENPTLLSRLHKMRPDARHRMAQLLAPTDCPIATLTHTDFWCNNLMFRDVVEEQEPAESDSHCHILDWQMVTYGRPSNDIALLLVTSVRTDLRREKEHDFLDIYWNTFIDQTSQLGCDVTNALQYNRQDLQREYQESLLLAMLLAIGSVDLALGDSRTEMRLMELLTDLSTAGIF